MPAHFEQLLLDDLQLLALLAGHPVRLLVQHPHYADIAGSRLASYSEVSGDLEEQLAPQLAELKAAGAGGDAACQ